MCACEVAALRWKDFFSSGISYGIRNCLSLSLSLENKRRGEAMRGGNYLIIVLMYVDGRWKCFN